MPFEASSEVSPTSDSSETIANVANRIFPEYIKLVNELFGSFEYLTKTGRDANQHGISGMGEAVTVGTDPNPIITQSPVDVMRKLVDLDADLSSFVTRLEGHQRLQDEVKSVQMKLLDQEVSIMDFTRQLGEKQDGLNELLDTARETLQEADESRNEPINVDELISYSIKIAKYTMDSEIPDRPHEPPIPQDHHMRHSLLFQGGHAMGVAAPAETEATDGTVKTPEPVHSDTMLADFGAHSPGKDAEQPHVDHEELLDLDL